MSARIGIALCLDAHGRWRAGRSYHYIDGAYAEAITRAGGTAVYLPPGDPESLVDGIDGLMVPGGDDFAPPRPYPGVVFDLVPDDQLLFDSALLGAALERSLPVLGICYGAQLLGLQFGAPLHYDLATDCPAAADHRLGDGDGRHPLVWEADSVLAGVIGDAPVNSLHHQALAHPGSLRASAHSPDGVIEAVEHPDRPGCVGVQWHPEKLADAGSAALFAWWVAGCGEGFE